MPIILPTPSPKRALFRKLFDATISMFPFGGGHLAAIYGLTHPPQSEIEQQRWREELTKFANDTEAALNFIMKDATLTEEAAYLGRWMAEKATRGWDDIFMYDQIAAQFPDASKNEIYEAAGELEAEGMIRVNAAIGHPVRHVVTLHKLFETFDPIIFEDVSPRQDAAVIAQELLDSSGTVSAAAIAERHGWSVRRINPALQIVGDMIAPGRKSRASGQPYAVRGMMADPQERVHLRRFVGNVAGAA